MERVKSMEAVNSMGGSQHAATTYEARANTAGRRRPGGSGIGGMLGEGGLCRIPGAQRLSTSCLSNNSSSFLSTIAWSICTISISCVTHDLQHHRHHAWSICTSTHRAWSYPTSRMVHHCPFKSPLHHASFICMCTTSMQ